MPRALLEVLVDWRLRPRGSACPARRGDHPLALLVATAARGQAPSSPSSPERAGASAKPKGPSASGSNANDIRRLSQHFIERGGDLSPWMFLPKENIKDLSTAEHPGMLTIWPGERGQDIKGILKDPIRIGDYPLPWEFHLGMVQNFIAWKGLSEKQINYAMGLNVAVTFSDPSTWPKDRSQWPPDTHSMQLLIVHLGNIGENYRQGVPQLKRTPLNMLDPSPEVYLVYGRGDLSPEARGNWNLAYPWVGPDTAPSGSWSKHAGPADFVIRFRVQVMSPRNLLVGVGYGNHPGWRYRVLDVSRFGRITGIWEIGPIYSLDRWIPNVLAKELNLDQPPAWLEGLKLRNSLLEKPAAENKTLTEMGKLVTTIDPPDPSFQYFLDYAVFYGSGPQNLEHLSEDFNIPGFLADQKYFIEGNAFCETHSNPGYLTATLYGMNGSWAMCPIVDVYGGIDFAQRKPPFEIELVYKSPADAQPWNLWWNVGVYDEKGNFIPGSPESKTSPARAAASSTPGPTTHTRSCETRRSSSSSIRRCPSRSSLISRFTCSSRSPIKRICTSASRWPRTTRGRFPSRSTRPRRSAKSPSLPTPRWSRSRGAGTEKKAGALATTRAIKSF